MDGPEEGAGDEGDAEAAEGVGPGRVGAGEVGAVCCLVNGWLFVCGGCVRERSGSRLAVHTHTHAHERTVARRAEEPGAKGEDGEERPAAPQEAIVVGGPDGGRHEDVVEAAGAVGG